MPNSQPILLLASASRRRRDLLHDLGLPFRVVVSGLPETARQGESPRDRVLRLAGEKAEAVLARHEQELVLAADTAVVVDSVGNPEVLGKPDDIEHARRMLRRLSGREHRVLTGVALRGPNGTAAEDVGTTYVRFAPLEDRQIEWYVATGEPMDKAGAYGIQGFAALFVEEIRGSWSNVVGLPIELLPSLFLRAGHDLFTSLRPVSPA